MSFEDSDDDDSMECPLCMEELDVDDRHFYPCTCGYQICQFCYKRIIDVGSKLCPACRQPYDESKIRYEQPTEEELERVRYKKTKPSKKQSVPPTPVSAGPALDAIHGDKAHLANVRVIQRNLVYVIGLVSPLNSDEVALKKAFGKYGKLAKVVLNKNNLSSNGKILGSAFLTYHRKEEALYCIKHLDGLIIDGSTIRASFGTTKYCSSFLRNTACSNADCMYLHEYGDDDDSFTKEELINMKTEFYEATHPSFHKDGTVTIRTRKGLTTYTLGQVRGTLTMQPATTSAAFPPLKSSRPPRPDETRSRSQSVLDQYVEEQYDDQDEQEEMQEEIHTVVAPPVSTTPASTDMPGSLQSLLSRVFIFDPSLCKPAAEPSMPQTPTTPIISGLSMSDTSTPSLDASFESKPVNNDPNPDWLMKLLQQTGKADHRHENLERSRFFSNQDDDRQKKPQVAPTPIQPTQYPSRPDTQQSVMLKQLLLGKNEAPNSSSWNAPREPEYTPSRFVPSSPPGFDKRSEVPAFNFNPPVFGQNNYPSAYPFGNVPPPSPPGYYSPFPQPPQGQPPRYMPFGPSHVYNPQLSGLANT